MSISIMQKNEEIEVPFRGGHKPSRNKKAGSFNLRK